MPEVTSLDFDVNDRALNEAAESERKERETGLNVLWDWYIGNHPKALKVSPGQADDNVVINLCGIAINDEVSFFAKDAPKFLSDEQPNEALTDLLNDSEFDAFIIDLALSGFVFGHNYVKLGFDNDTADPRFVLIDPRKVVVFYTKDFKQRRFWIDWWEGKTAYSEGTHYRQDIQQQDGRWLITDYVKKSSQFEVIQREDGILAQDTWAFDFPPLIDWKNTYTPYKFYGDSDLAYKIDLNRSVNFLASNEARIIKTFAHPRLVAKGFQLPRTETTLANGQIIETVQDAPGAVWEAPVDGDAYVINIQSDLAHSQNLRAELRETFFNAMRVVDLTTMKDKVGQITNFGLRVLYSNMLANISQKHEIYGRGLEMIMESLLQMQGEAVDISVEWSDPLPVNEVELADALIKQVTSLGLSQHTALTKLGYDPDKEEEKSEKEEKKRAREQLRLQQSQMANQALNQGRNMRQNNANLTQTGVQSGVGNGA